jgi:putative heme-binding domain-containing protein
LKTDGGSPSLRINWTTNEDDRSRPFALRRIYLPWADLSNKKTEDVAPACPPELEGGSWARGYQVFFSEQPGCAKCHTIYGRGGDLGPDLSNLIHRDYASVLRDITHPSFAINPDYLSYSVILTDGRTLSGVVHNTEGAIEIGDANGIKTKVAAGDIDEMTPSAVSTMPEGMMKDLGEERLRDLMTFLVTPPPQMPRDLMQGRPKPRTLAEVKAVLEGAPGDATTAAGPPEKPRPIHITLVAGVKDHGVGEHDYPAFQQAWAELLAAGENVEVSTAWEWPEKDAFEKSHVIIFYQHGDWNPQRAADIDPYLKRGGGLVYIHWALDGRGERGREFADRIGLAAGAPIGFRHGEVLLAFNRDTGHPIIRNFRTLSLGDETYWHLTGNLQPKNTLATAIEENAPRPQLWVQEHGEGRVFVSIPGHYSWTFDDPLFRVLLLRGIAWTADESVDRFNHLVWPGAEIAK